MIATDAVKEFEGSDSITPTFSPRRYPVFHVERDIDARELLRPRCRERPKAATAYRSFK